MSTESETYSIGALLWAAECIERRERDAEHGYAASYPPGPTAVPANHDYATKKSLSKTSSKKSGNRCTHNELEKNSLLPFYPGCRRAHLRSCLERLKDLVPLGGDSSRHTTLGLLTKARTFIKLLEEQDRRAAARREHLMREQRLLRLRVEEVTKDTYRTRNERSFSECSIATTSSSSSAYSEPASSDNSAESEEIDILGDGSSDSEDLVGGMPIPVLSDHRYGLKGSSSL